MKWSEFRASVWPPRLAVLTALVLAFGLGRTCTPGASAPSSEEEQHNSEHAHGQAVESWTCSMHPQIRFTEEGQCPICGMDLVSIGEGNSAASSNHVSISKEAAELARVRTAKVRRRDVSREHRLLGRLEYDETRLRTVTSWVAGRIDRLYVSSIGARVGKGTKLAQVYSPEVFAAHQDLIQATKQQKALGSALPVSRDAAEAMLNAARSRLRLLGLSDKVVGQMATESKPRQHVLIYAPFGGTIVEQSVHQGTYVATGSALFSLAGLSKLWVQLDAYETDLARLKVGDSVAVNVASFSDRKYEGKVTFVDPVLNNATRTARVRVEVENPKGELRPGMFADAVIQSGEEGRKHPLVIPESAPLFTGTRAVVYVAIQGGDRPTYAAREVQLAPRAGDVYPVVAGLKEGELVVVSGAFALDSELQIRGGNSMMVRPDDLDRASLEVLPLGKSERASLIPVFQSYAKVQESLAHDRVDVARKAFSDGAANVRSVAISRPEEAGRFWREHSRELETAFARGRDALAAPDATLEQAGESLNLLSDLMITLLKRFGNPLDQPVRIAECEMASGGEGARWLQLADRVENPYFGQKMFRCGEIGEEFEGTESSDPPAEAKAKSKGTKRPAAKNTGPKAKPGSAKKQAPKEVWTCPMHPQIQENSKGSCSICKMDLVHKHGH